MFGVVPKHGQSRQLQWINTWSGERVDATLDRPGVYQVSRPAAFGAAPAVLIVRTKS
jgi:hypothetical protein